MQKNIRNILTPSFARCMGVVTIDLLWTWMVNTFLYPQFNDILPAARDASSIVGVTVLVLLAVWALRKPASIDERTLTTLSMVGFALSMALVVMGIAMRNPVVLLVGACLRGASTRWFVVFSSMALCSLDKRSCMLCIGISFLLSYLLRIPFSGMDAMTAQLVLLVVPFLTYILCRPLSLKVLEDVRTGVPPVEASITQPAAYLPFAHNLFIAIFAFRMAFGFALTFGAVDGNPQQTFIAFIPLAIVFAVALLPAMPKADVLYQAAALFIVAGFLAIIVFEGRSEMSLFSAANGLLYAGSECFDALVWFSLVSIGAHNKANAFAVFAWGKAASSAGLLLGATIGHGVNNVADSLSIALCIAVVLLLFVAVNLTVLKRFSFQATIDGVQSALPAATIISSIGLKEKSAFVAKRHQLTPRETEFLEMLSHGRNGPFIQEKLVLSRNTVKTHVANIYTKLDVHSQQELIDLVEQAQVQEKQLAS